jgi:hypothetical protein
VSLRQSCQSRLRYGSSLRSPKTAGRQAHCHGAIQFAAHPVRLVPLLHAGCRRLPQQGARADTGNPHNKVQWKLPAEPKHANLFAKEMAPELLLGFRELSTQFTRALDRPPPPNQRPRRVRLLAPSRKGRGRSLARSLSITRHQDFSASISAPRPCIRAIKFGNEVAIMEPSSTVTGSSDARPITRKLIAMR